MTRKTSYGKAREQTVRLLSKQEEEVTSGKGCNFLSVPACGLVASLTAPPSGGRQAIREELPGARYSSVFGIHIIMHCKSISAHDAAFAGIKYFLLVQKRHDPYTRRYPSQLGGLLKRTLVVSPLKAKPPQASRLQAGAGALQSTLPDQCMHKQIRLISSAPAGSMLQGGAPAFSTSLSKHTNGVESKL